MTWQDAIDKLKLWEDPEYLREDDLIPPTEDALRVANFVANLAKAFGNASLYRMVPGGNGDVHLELGGGIGIEIGPYGQAEVVMMVRGKVVGREAIN